MKTILKIVSIVSITILNFEAVQARTAEANCRQKLNVASEYYTTARENYVSGNDSYVESIEILKQGLGLEKFSDELRNSKNYYRESMEWSRLAVKTFGEACSEIASGELGEKADSLALKLNRLMKSAYSGVTRVVYIRGVPYR